MGSGLGSETVASDAPKTACASGLQERVRTGFLCLPPALCPRCVCQGLSERGHWFPFGSGTPGLHHLLFCGTPKTSALGVCGGGSLGLRGTGVRHVQRWTSRAPECGGPGASGCRSCSVRDSSRVPGARESVSAREPPSCGRVMSSGFLAGPASEELPTGARWGAGAGRGRGRGPGALRLG